MGLKTRAYFAPAVLRSGLQAFSLILSLLLIACGGGGGGGGISSSVVSVSSSSASSVGITSSSISSQSISSIPIASSSVSSNVIISGKVTYDFIPPNENNIGLNYLATSSRAGRGLVVELLDGSNLVLASAATDNNGDYSFTIPQNSVVKVRVKAQLLQSESPSWNFTVTDNTNNNALYSMEGSLIAASDATAVRNLHAPSGWTGSGYTQPRVAAPFAILDTVLMGIEKIVDAGNERDFQDLEFRWSVNNKAAEGEKELGEIGTSYFSGSEIYVLGDQNSDTDEYDPHVILHEWGHYIESLFSRSDSLGGDHPIGSELDLRVAMSEGLANALSAMMLDDAVYRDTSGMQQMDGFTFDVGRENSDPKGWYSESSIQSVLFNFYTSSSGKLANNFADIFNVLSSDNYSSNTALISIYVFADVLRSLMPEQVTNFDNLLMAQNIKSTNAFGEGETNSGSYTESLPIYKRLPTDGTTLIGCSTNIVGAYNRLGSAQFIRLDIESSGTYKIDVEETAEDSGDSDPDIYLYRKGDLIQLAEGIEIDKESLSYAMSAGTYVVELVDARVMDTNLADTITACFNVRAERLN